MNVCRAIAQADLSPWRPRFAPGSAHVGFMVDKVEMGQENILI
jgi:hypothetical protein